MTKYPEVSVTLTEKIEGNEYNLLGVTLKALQSAEVSKKECSEFLEEATSGDYNKMIATIVNWVTVK